MRGHVGNGPGCRTEPSALYGNELVWGDPTRLECSGIEHAGGRECRAAGRDLSDKAVVAAGVVADGRLECAGSRDQVRAGVIAGQIDVAGGVDCQPGWIRAVEPAGTDVGGE